MSSFESDLASALDRHLGPETPSHLAESIRYSLLAPGKRIRPRLLLSCAEMIGLPNEAALPAAIALEMIHCFTLIHDDLPCMDDDDFRRGRPSNHRKFGEATALLAGDALIALAVDSFLDANPSSKKTVDFKSFTQGLRRLTWAMGPRGVLGGQAAEATLGPKSKLEELHAMHAGKTGALFYAALLIPRDLNGIDRSSAQGEAIELFARGLGMSFQIADDLQDASKEMQDPTNIAYYLSPENAREIAHNALSLGSTALKKEWPDKSRPLLAIADEVMRSL